MLQANKACSMVHQVLVTSVSLRNWSYYCMLTNVIITCAVSLIVEPWRMSSATWKDVKMVVNVVFCIVIRQDKLFLIIKSVKRVTVQCVHLKLVKESQVSWDLTSLVVFPTHPTGCHANSRTLNRNRSRLMVNSNNISQEACIPTNRTLCQSLWSLSLTSCQMRSRTLCLLLRSSPPMSGAPLSHQPSEIYQLNKFWGQAFLHLDQVTCLTRGSVA